MFLYRADKSRVGREERAESIKLLLLINPSIFLFSRGNKGYLISHILWDWKKKENKYRTKEPSIIIYRYLKDTLS